jgi:hypothetical protein
MVVNDRGVAAPTDATHVSDVVRESVRNASAKRVAARACDSHDSTVDAKALECRRHDDDGCGDSQNPAGCKGDGRVTTETRESSHMAGMPERVLCALTGAEEDQSTLDIAPLPNLSALSEMEILSCDDFEQEFKDGLLAEVLILQPPLETAELSAISSLDDEIEGFRQRCSSRRGSAILRNPTDK